MKTIWPKILDYVIRYGTYHIQQGSKLFFSPENEYSDLESSGQKIEMAATALENQKLEKVLYTYKQVGGPG